jgi:hypothetical protein
MRKTIYYFYVILIFGTCSNSEQSDINIYTAKDTVNVGEIFKAEISIPYYKDILPKVYIISKGDTIPIPYYADSKCAVFQSSGKSEGIRKYNGLADYYNQEGELKRESFIIEYYVKNNVGL